MSYSGFAVTTAGLRPEGRTLAAAHMGVSRLTLPSDAADPASDTRCSVATCTGAGGGIAVADPHATECVGERAAGEGGSREAGESLKPPVTLPVPALDCWTGLSGWRGAAGTPGEARVTSALKSSPCDTSRE